jgi:hypothetical protein
LVTSSVMSSVCFADPMGASKRIRLVWAQEKADQAK